MLGRGSDELDKAKGKLFLDPFPLSPHHSSDESRQIKHCMGCGPVSQLLYKCAVDPVVSGPQLIQTSQTWVCIFTLKYNTTFSFNFSSFERYVIKPLQSIDRRGQVQKQCLCASCQNAPYWSLKFSMHFNHTVIKQLRSEDKPVSE